MVNQKLKKKSYRRTKKKIVCILIFVISSVRKKKHATLEDLFHFKALVLKPFFLFFFFFVFYWEQKINKNEMDPSATSQNELVKQQDEITESKRAVVNENVSDVEDEEDEEITEDDNVEEGIVIILTNTKFIQDSYSTKLPLLFFDII